MEKVVVVEGLRTPFCKIGTYFFDTPAYELGVYPLRELLWRLPGLQQNIDEVVFGCVAQPPEASNIARVISVLAGLDVKIPAHTVCRNCASGLEAITTSYEKIIAGSSEAVIAGGVESMSGIPFFYSKDIQKFFWQFNRAKTPLSKLKSFKNLKFLDFFKPKIGLKCGLSDILCTMNMGQTAEVLAKKYRITRKEQDEFALRSHSRAKEALDFLKEEIVKVFHPSGVIEKDNGIREDVSLDKLSKLKPCFNKFGTVTAGNSSQITDGSCAVVVMSEKKARTLGYEILGSIHSYTYVGLEPEIMGLGPAYAIYKLLKKQGLSLGDIELIEINEAFAAQVIAVEREIEKLGLGKIKREILNVNGGAIALGHPVGASGARLVLTLLKEMKRRNLSLGLASLCVGGGQAGAIILER